MLKLKKFDLFLLILFLATSLVAGYFYVSQQSQPSKATQRLIGSVHASSEKVYRKTADDFFYSPLATGNKLYLNDQVTTGANSTAVLSLEQKTQIEMDPLSHIVLRPQQSGYGIQIREGVLSASIARGESILIDGEVTTASLSSTAKVRYNKSLTHSEIEVLEGEAEIIGPDEKYSLKSGESKQIMTHKGRSTLSLLQPAANADLPLATPRVEVTWSPVAGADNYETQLFQDQSLIISSESTEPHTVLSLPSFGKFKVQVAAWKKLDRIAQSEKRSFSIHFLPTFKLVAPLGGTISLKHDLEVVKVDFQWEGKDAAHLEIALEQKNPEGAFVPFTKKDIHAEVQSQTLDLPPGQFRWQLIHSAGTTEWVDFSITKDLSPLLPPPKISKVSRELSSQEKKDGLKIAWTPVRDASGYEVEWLDQNVPAPSAEWKTGIRAPISSTYRVRTLNKDNVPGEWSTPAILKIFEKQVVAAKSKPTPTPSPQPTITPVVQKVAAPEPPQEGNLNIPRPKVLSPLPASNFISKGGVVTLSIRLTDERCENYEVEIDGSEKFLSPMVLAGPDPNLEIKLKRGPFYLRARCWKEGDMGTWSRPTPIRVQ